MRGTDVSADELREARFFIENALKRPLPDEGLNVRNGDLIRLVAWYGAIRAEGGNAPGRVVVNPRPIVVGDFVTSDEWDQYAYEVSSIETGLAFFKTGGFWRISELRKVDRSLLPVSQAKDYGVAL